MELIKLFADNEIGNIYYNPKFDYLAFEGANGDVIFNKILDSNVTPKNMIEFTIFDTSLSEDDQLYSKMLLDDDWQYSDKIVISSELKNNETRHYSLDKYYSYYDDFKWELDNLSKTFQSYCDLTKFIGGLE